MPHATTQEPRQDHSLIERYLNCASFLWCYGDVYSGRRQMERAYYGWDGTNPLCFRTCKVRDSLDPPFSYQRHAPLS
jgi:hypothetical protein